MIYGRNDGKANTTEVRAKNERDWPNAKCTVGCGRDDEFVVAVHHNDSQTTQTTFCRPCLETLAAQIRNALFITA